LIAPDSGPLQRQLSPLFLAIRGSESSLRQSGLTAWMGQEPVREAVQTIVLPNAFVEVLLGPSGKH
jgi:hypothetical protein